MTIRVQSQCLGCQITLHTKTARSHLKSCIARTDTTPRNKPKPMLLVSATAGYDDTKTVYALYTLMPKNATLRDIHELLEETWLECCRHLSRFDSGATWFVSDGFETDMYDFDILTFDHRAARAIPPNSEAQYEYDMGSTTHLTVRVQPAPEKAQAWLAQHGIDPGDPILRNLIPEVCDNCQQEATHLRSDQTLCTNCIPGNHHPFVELPARTPPPCNECGGPATRQRQSHTSCEACRQEDRDNYRPLVNSPRDGVDCFDQRTPAEQREFEDDYIEIGHDLQTGMSFYAPKEAAEPYGQARPLAEPA